MSNSKLIGQTVLPSDNSLISFHESEEARDIRETPCYCNFCGESMPWGSARSFGTCLSCNRNSEGKSLVEGCSSPIAKPKFRHDGSLISSSSRFNELRILKRNLHRKVEDILDPIPGPFDPLAEGLFDTIMDTWMDLRKIQTLNFTDGLEEERDRISAISMIYISTFNDWHNLRREGLKTQLSLIERFINYIDF